MTGRLADVLVGAPVLIDTSGMWAGRVLRGQRGVVVHRYDPGIGQALDADLVVCIGPCGRPRHTVDCHTAVAFKRDELIAVPADSDQALYGCCTHMHCPAGCTGHPVPCTQCGQPLRRTTDQQVAQAMATEQAS